MKRLARLLHDLKDFLGEEVAADPTNRLLYARDMFPGLTLALRPKQGREPSLLSLPDIVCWPRNAEEVCGIVKKANRYRVPVIPFGGGSGVLGGTIPVQGGIILDLKKMDRIVAIHREKMTADIECGKLGLQLEEELNQEGFTLGHFPSSIMCATLGGYLATRSAGQMSSRYGKIEEMVEEVEVVTPEGELIPFGGRVKVYPRVKPKDLFVGCEGTLGVITKARLKIHPLPPGRRLRGVSFNRLESALTVCREIMQSGLKPSVLRLYDPLDTLLFEAGSEEGKGLVSKVSGLFFKPFEGILEKIKEEGHNYVLSHPRLSQTLFQLLPMEVVLIVGFEGEAKLIEEQERLVLSFCRRFISRDLGPEMGDYWWKHRYSVSFKMPELFLQEGIVDTIEMATTWEKLLLLYRKVHRVMSAKVLVMAHFSHAYPEGCSIYFTFAAKTGSYEKDETLYGQVWKRAMEACIEVGGTISHHHGIGLWKAPYLERELGDCMKLFRSFKKKLDPKNVMNPGKMGL